MREELAVRLLKYAEHVAIPKAPTTLAHFGKFTDRVPVVPTVSSLHRSVTDNIPRRVGKQEQLEEQHF